MIVCVTPNVAIDRTLFIPGYASGGVFRPEKQVVQAGGKGLNVARAIKTLGGKPVCAGFLAGYNGQYAAHLTESEGMASQWTWLETGETRNCMILVDTQAGQTSVINNQGPATSPQDWANFSETLLNLAEEATFICFCGSLPAVPQISVYTDLLQALTKKPAQVWVDNSGKWLDAAAQVPGLALKINDEEAATLTGSHPQTTEELIAAGQARSAISGAPVVITAGAKGAIMVTEKEAVYVNAPRIDVINDVGSGDSFLAGLLVALEQGNSAGESLRRAVATGAANASSSGGANFSLNTVEALYHQTQTVKANT